MGSSSPAGRHLTPRASRRAAPLRKRRGAQHRYSGAVELFSHGSRRLARRGRRCRGVAHAYPPLPAWKRSQEIPDGAAMTSLSPVTPSACHPLLHTPPCPPRCAGREPDAPAARGLMEKGKTRLQSRSAPLPTRWGGAARRQARGVRMRVGARRATIFEAASGGEGQLRAGEAQQRPRPGIGPAPVLGWRRSLGAGPPRTTPPRRVLRAGEG
jgi:hypothetical protein